MATEQAINKCLVRTSQAKLRMVASLNGILKNLEVNQADISKILSMVYTNISRNNLHAAAGGGRVCIHGFTFETCKICSAENDYLFTTRNDYGGG